MYHPTKIHYSIELHKAKALHAKNSEISNKHLGFAKFLENKYEKIKRNTYHDSQRDWDEYVNNSINLK